MARTRDKIKGRKTSGSFVSIPHNILESEEYANLSACAVKCLMDLLSQYRGTNNGDITAAWKIMKPKGWKSKDTLYRALYELTEGGWIIKTRTGGRRIPNLYAVTWKPINECGGKLEVKPSRVALNSWNKKKITGPVGVPTWPGRRTNKRTQENTLAREPYQ